MAYETGTAIDRDDLLDKLRLFAVAQGWTAVHWATDGAGKRLHLTRAGQLYHGWHAYATGVLRHVASTDFNAGAASNAQPGTAAAVDSNSWTAGPFTAYHFFVTADYIHVVVELSAGNFVHFCHGELDPAVPAQRCAYVQATNWIGSPYNGDPSYSEHSVPFDGRSISNSRGRYLTDLGAGLQWLQQTSDDSVSPRAIGTARGSGLSASLFTRAAASAISGQVPLLPLYILAESGSSELFHVVGVPRDVREVNLTNLSPGQLMTIGSDEWLCFPLRVKSAVSGVSSGVYGLAYRRNA